MAKWTEKLKDHAESKKRKTSSKPPAVRKPLPPVHEFYITVRGASENDPGEVAVGFFTVEDGLVTLTNQNGRPLDDAKPQKLGEADPKYIAGLLLRGRRQEGNSDFNRPLHYERAGWR